MKQVIIISIALCIIVLGFSCPACGDAPQISSAAVPTVAKGWAQRHSEKVQALGGHKYDLLLIGDSITHNLDNPPFKATWDHFYAPRNAIALGGSGERTENILWNLQNGELDNQSPKVAVLLIGTNNSDDANYQDVSTPEQIAEGTAAIVKLLRMRTPETRIVVLRIFPRQNHYRNGKTERGSAESRSATNARASELVSKLADGQHIFFLDVNHVFLRLDGTIDPELMPDLLHPSPKGAYRWAQAMDPLLTELMGDKPLDTEAPKNSAVIPTPKLENDSYEWWKRHAEELQARKTINPRIVLIGDSITHFWGGPPRAATQNGPRAWSETFGAAPVLNLGFGWDRTQNVLWRLDHGEFDGLHPAVVVLNIGTNNFTGTVHARENTPQEVYEGIVAICTRIRSKSPSSRIIVMCVFPRGPAPNEGLRPKIAELNRLLAKELKGIDNLQVLDIGSQLLNSDGTMSKEIMGDYTHPTEKGYSIWGKALLAAGVAGAATAEPARSAVAQQPAKPATAPLAKPTAEQVAWHDSELGMFIHFGPATWQDVNEDNLTTPLAEIDPRQLDTDQWAQAAVDMGARYIVFVAKHSGGFCWWQTDTTDYSVKHTPWRGGKGDVLADLAASCKKKGIKLGVYLSPTDHKHQASGGGRCATPELQDAYNKLYRQQLTEVLSRYGEIYEVWFDGSTITPVGDILKQHAPRAMVFQGPHATIRWVGNEDGQAPYPAWNSLSEADARSGVATARAGNPDGLAWLPNECDAEMRDAWMWNSHNAASLKSAAQLMNLYEKSVGHGAVLLLNQSPDRSGLIPEGDVKRGKEFGDEIRRRYGQSLAETAGHGEEVELKLTKPAKIDRLMLMEDTTEGERVREYIVEGLKDGQWRTIGGGTAIGHKRIEQVTPIEVSAVRLRITRSAAEPLIRKLAVYQAMWILTAPRSTPSAMASAKKLIAALANDEKIEL